MDYAFLDLNEIEDAKIYIRSWIERDQYSLGEDSGILKGDEEDILRVARQLFLFHDLTPIAGERQ